LPDTRGYGGCVSIHLVQNQDVAQNIVIVEQWDTRQHYKKYLAWPIERGDIKILIGMVDGEPSIRFLIFLVFDPTD